MEIMRDDQTFQIPIFKKSLFNHMLQMMQQIIIIVINIVYGYWFFDQSQLWPGKDLKQFFKCPNATRHSNESIG